MAMTAYSLCKGPGSIPGQGNRPHMPQLRVCMPQLKILCSATKTRCNQVNNFLLKKALGREKKISIEMAMPYPAGRQDSIMLRTLFKQTDFD